MNINDMKASSLESRCGWRARNEVHPIYTTLSRRFSRIATTTKVSPISQAVNVLYTLRSYKLDVLTSLIALY